MIPTPPGSPYRCGLVALIGRPNVGKSTLLNRLLGRKVSIVSSKPQTTRNRITAVVERPGIQAIVVDTPGVHRPLHRMNRRMMRLTGAVLEEVDLLAVMTDAGQRFGSGDGFLLRMVGRHPGPRLLLVNKIDAVPKPALLPLIQHWSEQLPFDEVIPISALEGDGVELIVDGFRRHLPIGPRLFADATEADLGERFLAAEVVREKILERTRDELPYATTVLLEDYTPSDRHGLRVAASILVERDSQRGILIGRHGQTLKHIGQAARLELGAILGTAVHLDLRVKVRSRWRDDDRLLDRLGLER